VFYEAEAKDFGVASGGFAFEAAFVEFFAEPFFTGAV